MKTIYWLTACCLITAGLASCGDDGNGGNNATGQQGTTTPSTGDLGIARPVTSITGYGSSYFNYENGKLTSGYSEGSSFTIAHHPLAIRMSYEGTNERYEENYTNIRVNSSGFVTYAEYSATDTYNGESEYYSGTARMQYDADGHITQKSVTLREGNYYEDTYVISYTWEDGNVTRIQIDETEKTPDETNTYKDIYKYTYSDPSQNINSGVYLYDMWYSTYDFMWYAGMFGKPTRNIPIAMRYTYSYTYEDGTNSEYYGYDYNINTNYNDDGSVARIEYHQPGNSYAEELFIYGYDGTASNEGNSRMLRKSADNSRLRKGPAFLHRR